MATPLERNSIRSWQPTDLTELELQRGHSVNRPVPRHWHDEYQFVVIEAGRGDLTYRGRDFLTPPASLFIVHPGEVHSNRAFDSNGCSFRTIFLKTALVQAVVAEIQGNGQGLPFFPSTLVFDHDMIAEYVALHRLFEVPNATLEREVQLRNFLVGLISRYAENRFSLSMARPGRGAIQRAGDYLAANYTENVSLGQLANLVDLSPFHFSRIFSEYYGMPPHEFLVQLRLTQAKRFLREGLNIAHVAHQTGFADQSHLTRHFKRTFGITPGQFI
jgi:AraC-like DNA-binding protein